MTTTESSGTVVILDVLTRGSPALRGGLTDRWRVVESIPAAGSGRCGLVGVSDGADAALGHALQDPENVEVLVLVSPSAIRPANAAGDANDDAAELGVPRQLYLPVGVNQFCRFTSLAWPRCWAALVR